MQTNPHTPGCITTLVVDTRFVTWFVPFFSLSLHIQELALSWATLQFVGWVEPAPGFVGFRCTQPNLHFAGVIANCETQQRLISEPSPEFTILVVGLQFLSINTISK